MPLLALCSLLFFRSLAFFFFFFCWRGGREVEFQVWFRGSLWFVGLYSHASCPLLFGGRATKKDRGGLLLLLLWKRATDEVKQKLKDRQSTIRRRSDSTAWKLFLSFNFFFVGATQDVRNSRIYLLFLKICVILSRFMDTDFAAKKILLCTVDYNLIFIIIGVIGK